MSNISVSLPSDGDTIDVADYNTPITTIVNEINGGLDNSNISASAAIDASKLATGTSGVGNAQLNTTAGDINGVWKDWTVSWTNLTVGSGTVVAKYTQIGKTVHYRLSFTFGSGSSVGAATFSLPVTAANLGLYTPIGNVNIFDSGTTLYCGSAFWNSTTVAKLTVFRSDATYTVPADLSSTVPMTWTTNDQFIVSGTYEAA